MVKPVGLVVGVPTRGKKVAIEWALGFWMQNYPLNTERNINVVKNKPVDEARNQIVKNALDWKAKYIWFLDDDVVAPSFACRKLMYDLEQADDDVMVAGGIYPSKEDIPAPMVFKENGNGPFWKWKANEVFECEGLGTGCMLIKTEVFAHLTEPWFKTVDECPDGGEVVMRRVTDDLYFCKKVVEAGFKIIADGSVICSHWDYTDDPPKQFLLPKDSYPFKETEVRTNGQSVATGVSAVAL